MNGFTAFQMILNTADEEALLFNGFQCPPVQERKGLLQDGVYRVLAGELFRVVGGVPPEIVDIRDDPK